MERHVSLARNEKFVATLRQLMPLPAHPVGDAKEKANLANYCRQCGKGEAEGLQELCTSDIGRHQVQITGSILPTSGQKNLRRTRLQA